MTGFSPITPQQHQELKYLGLMASGHGVDVLSAVQSVASSTTPAAPRFIDVRIAATEAWMFDGGHFPHVIGAPFIIEEPGQEVRVVRVVHRNEMLSSAARLGLDSSVAVPQTVYDLGFLGLVLVVRTWWQVTLADLLRSSGRSILQDQFSMLLLDLITDVDILHSKGLIHGDIKASNVIIRDGKTALADWSLNIGDMGHSSSLETMRWRDLSDFRQVVRQVLQATDEPIDSFSIHRDFWKSASLYALRNGPTEGLSSKDLASAAHHTLEELHPDDGVIPRSVPTLARETVAKRISRHPGTAIGFSRPNSLSELDSLLEIDYLAVPRENEAEP